MNQKVMDNIEAHISPRELAQYLNIKERTVQHWTRYYTDFPVLRLPGGLRFKRSQVINWLDQFQKNKNGITKQP